jgi:hypothetical protein
MQRLAVLVVAALCVAVAPAGVQFFSTQAAFDTFRTSQGYTLYQGTEDFEGALVGPGGVALLNEPLTQGVANNPDGQGFPNGLDEPLSMFTSSGGGLVALGVGLVGNSTKVVGANTWADRTWLDFTGFGGYEAVALDIMDGTGSGNGTVNVYDMRGGLIGTQAGYFGPADGSFWGFGTDDGSPIGSVEFWADNDNGELCDNVQLYNIPEPTSMLLLGLGLALVRRR